MRAKTFDPAASKYIAASANAGLPKVPDNKSICSYQRLGRKNAKESIEENTRRNDVSGSNAVKVRHASENSGGGSRNPPKESAFQE